MRTRFICVSLGAVVAALAALPVHPASASMGAIANARQAAGFTTPSVYWLVGGDGEIFSFANGGHLGFGSSMSLNRPVVGIAPAPDRQGYWLATADGGVFTFGSAGFYGSQGGKPLNQPVVGMAATPDGKGYWLVAADGGVFTFGSARFLGSTGGIALNRPVVGMAATPTGNGYWLVAADGGIFTFGDATFLGSTGCCPLNQPIVGMALTSDAKGYWLVAADGGIFTFGDAQFFGSTGSLRLSQPITGMAPTADNQGYWLVAADGGIFTFGNAPFAGSAGGYRLPHRVVAITAALSGYQPVLPAHGGVWLDKWGGLHPFGGLGLDVTGASYWSGQDTARGLVIRPDGSGGWVLDRSGGIHAFGGAAPVTPPITWPGQDMATALAMTSAGVDTMPDGRQGYVLDRSGQIHPWGGAPGLTAPAMPAGDTATGLAIHVDGAGNPDGGWVMDPQGQTFPFGAAPSLGSTAPYPNRYPWRQLHASGQGFLQVGTWGITLAIGNVGSPYWSGYADFGGLDATRDVVIVDPTNPAVIGQPVTQPASNAFWAAVNERKSIDAPVLRQLRNLDCEVASLQTALWVRGIPITQDWALAQIGADLRPAVKDSNGLVLQWGDPYVTFVGDVNGAERLVTGYGVYYPPIVATGQKVGATLVGGENWKPGDIYWQLGMGNPVIVWIPLRFANVADHVWTAWDGRPITYNLWEHTVTLVGVDAAAGTVIEIDPFDATVHTVSMAQFEASFAKFNNMAVVVQ